MGLTVTKRTHRTHSPFVLPKCKLWCCVVQICNNNSKCGIWDLQNEIASLPSFGVAREVLPLRQWREQPNDTERPGTRVHPCIMQIVGPS